MRKIVLAAASLSALAVTACRESTSPTASELPLTMASAYSAAPAGFGSLSSSYVGDAGAAFQPSFDQRGPGGPGRGHDGHGGLGGPFGGPGFGLGFMGGGLLGGFHGDGIGRGFFP